ncbi:hypothetical protein GOODEAATRI_028869, partial [Goodea atripinnis]
TTPPCDLSTGQLFPSSTWREAWVVNVFLTCSTSRKPTFSLSSGFELRPPPYSRAYCCHISASLLWRALTRPRSSFSLGIKDPACAPWLSVRFSTTALTRICRIYEGGKGFQAK